MALYVYCPTKSAGALTLSKALGAERLRGFDGMDFWNKRHRFNLKEGDVVVCWGGSIPDVEGVRILNSEDYPSSPFSDLQAFCEVGISTIRIYGEATKHYDPSLLPLVVKVADGTEQLVVRDFPTKVVFRESLMKEHRFHIFGGKCLLSGIKTPREGFKIVAFASDWKPDRDLIHPWIRNFERGWEVIYGSSPPKLRTVAKSVINTLKLMFGEVSIAEDFYGRVRVLKVNRTPTLEGPILGVYVKAIKGWIEKGEEANGDIRGVDEGEPFPQAVPFGI